MSRLTRNELAKLLELIEHPGVPVHPEVTRGEVIAALRHILRRMTERGARAKADGGAS